MFGSPFSQREEDGGGLVLVLFFLVWDGPSLVIPVFLSDSGYPYFFYL